jgi:hypothetical protein
MPGPLVGRFSHHWPKYGNWINAHLLRSSRQNLKEKSI